MIVIVYVTAIQGREQEQEKCYSFHGGYLYSQGAVNRAAGRPCLVMMMVSPLATSSRSADKWVLASHAPTSLIMALAGRN